VGDYLFDLYSLLHNTYNAGKIIINKVEGESINPHIKLTNDISLYIMAPTHSEIYKWFNNEYPSYPEEELGNKPNVNFLSTVIKIYTNDWYVLLTADADKTTLKYYDTRKPNELNGRLVLAQSPHHGSDKNHNNTFWEKRIIKGQKTAIVFSVGKNGYKHPSKDTVDFFMSNGFDLYSTNQVGSLAKVNIKAKDGSNALDSFGTIVFTKKDKFNGDKAFNIDLAGNVIAI
jgi:beta-lactamase superfamily II metal-dependent hydrolase